MRTAASILAGLLVLVACSTKYIHEGQISPTFDTRQSYSVAVMPFLVRGLQTPGGFERDLAYDFLVRRLMGTGKLMTMDGFTIKSLVQKKAFGQQNGVDPVEAREIGKELGAYLVCLAELSFEQVEPTVILVATVKLYAVDSPLELYSGLGRMANPLSLNAAAELALDLATRKLVERLR